MKLRQVGLRMEIHMPKQRKVFWLMNHYIQCVHIGQQRNKREPATPQMISWFLTRSV